MKKNDSNGNNHWPTSRFKQKTKLIFLFLIVLASQVKANASTNLESTVREAIKEIEDRKDNGPLIKNTSTTPDAVQQTVSGNITDEAGMPMLGVNIIEKGTNNGTTSDFDGNYTIRVSSSDAVLVFSFIGYESKEITVGNQSTINTKMVPSAAALDEVVVVGYGTQKKLTLTGSVVDVEGEELTKSPNPNVTATLQGRLPGLVAVQRSGQPGSDDANILIRGNGTTGNNAPLIIIDGVERSLIGRLNPDDIESISVLKDASAAIYGARGGNGVILVTTKKGDSGKPQFSVSYNSAFNRPTQVPDMMDAVTYAQVYNEGHYYRAGRPDSGHVPFYSDSDIEKYGNGSDPVLFPNTDWMGDVLKDYSLQQRLNMQVTGGSEAARYLLSFGATTQDGDFKYMPTEFKQFNFRGKIDVNINENLSIGANISAILTKREYAIVNNTINFVNLLQASPLLVSRYPNGLIAPGRFGESPLLLDQRGYNRTYDEPVYSTFTLGYKVPFIEGLRFDASYNYDLSLQFQKRLNLPYTYHEYNVNTGEYDLKQGTGASTVELWD